MRGEHRAVKWGGVMVGVLGLVGTVFAAWVDTQTDVRATQVQVVAIDSRQNRFESRVDERLQRLEDKIDRLLERE